MVCLCATGFRRSCNHINFLAASTVVESSLNNQSEVTEDDRSDIEKLYNELVATMVSMKAFNPRLPTVEFVKGKLFASDNLDVFYVSTQN